MPETFAVLLPLLAYLATTAGAGIAASDLFTGARVWWVNLPSDPDSKFERAVDKLLTTRVGARLSVLVLAMLISVGASAIIARASGQPVSDAIDQAIAAALASQIYHLHALIGQPSIDPTLSRSR